MLAFRLLCSLVAALLPTAFAAAALPVIPGAAGFGVETPAGRGGTVIRVTNLDADGRGSLAACVGASGPRVCVFEVAGTIRRTEELVIQNPYLTIAGQTAPSPGITLRGAALLIGASDVLVQHLRVRVGDDSNGPEPSNRDALRIESPASRPLRNVVVDHCSFSWSIDEMASIWEGAGEVSILNSIFAEPLNDSLHPDGPHGYGILLGTGPNGVGRVALIGNLLAHQVERNPLSWAAGFVAVNNVVYNRANYDMQLAGSGAATLNSIVGNVFIRGRDYSGSWAPVIVRGGSSDPVVAGTKVYLADNAGVEASSDSWSMASVQAPISKSSVQLAAAPVWPSGLSARKTANGAVEAWVLANVGARPADRDAVDARIIQGVKSRSGQVINCVSADGTARCGKNGGGWPAAVRITRALQLPSSPNAVTSSGYTNLELWLHTLAAAVEGRGSLNPEPPRGIAIE